MFCVVYIWTFSGDLERILLRRECDVWLMLHLLIPGLLKQPIPIFKRVGLTTRLIITPLHFEDNVDPEDFWSILYTYYETAINTWSFTSITILFLEGKSLYRNLVRLSQNPNVPLEILQMSRFEENHHKVLRSMLVHPQLYLKNGSNDK